MEPWLFLVAHLSQRLSSSFLIEGYQAFISHMLCVNFQISNSPEPILKLYEYEFKIVQSITARVRMRQQ